MSSAYPFAWVLWAVVLGDRLLESVVASSNLRWARARGGVEHDRGFTLVLHALHGAWFVGWAAELWLRPGGLVVPVWVAAGVLVVLQAGRVWVILSLGRRWNTRVVTLPGAPVLKRGPYRLVRHPNYLVVALELAAYPALCGCWWTAGVGGVVNLAVLARRIRAEDEALGKASAVPGRVR